MIAIDEIQPGATMGYHPVNLAIRFFLELSALAAMGRWGWEQGQGIQRLIIALGAPVFAAVMWGIFAVPNDPSRLGNAPVPVPGALRLVLEASFFLFAAWALHATGKTSLSEMFAAVVVLHYAVSYDRIAWLLRNRQSR
jgi:hypothetical protein